MAPVSQSRLKILDYPTRPNTDGTGHPIFDKGVEYNAWLEYHWDTVLEFCLMMLEAERYSNRDIHPYLPFIESCVTFFDEHYQYLAKMRGRRALDGNNQLVLYPGSGAETYKIAYNSNSTIAGLQTILSRMLVLPETYLGAEKRKSLTAMLSRIPPLSYREFNGHVTLSPAKLWERINHSETPQLYPVFPWGIYGVGQPGLDTAINTWRYDTSAVKARSHVGWRQDNIFSARLGLTEEAAKLNVMKLQNSGRRFPAFWGPGMTGLQTTTGRSRDDCLQEMLMQVHDEEDIPVSCVAFFMGCTFQTHAPYQTVIEGILKKWKG
jgi:hypothetical protein